MLLLLYGLLTIEASLLDTEMTKHPGNQTVEYNNFQDMTQICCMIICAICLSFQVQIHIVHKDDMT
jgi:hypothetical protein